jgi:hypothetical protein
MRKHQEPRRIGAETPQHVRVVDPARPVGAAPSWVAHLQRQVGNAATAAYLLRSAAVAPVPTVQRDPPRPVGFGQDQPETYEPAFMKDALPGAGKILRALAAVTGWMTIMHIAEEASRKETSSEVLQVIIAGGLLGGLLRDDAVAEVLPQSWLIALAQREVSSKGPLARQHLDHYLAGSGSDFVEDVATLYRQDGGFKQESEIQIDNGGALSGQFSVSQASYWSQEWQYALGAVDEVHYELVRVVDEVHAEVSIRLRDNYEWHPDEYRSWGSHIAHVALEAAKQNGAKNYWEVGQATIVLNVGRALVGKLREAKRP